MQSPTMADVRHRLPMSAFAAAFPIIFAAVYLGCFLLVASRLNLDRLNWDPAVVRDITSATALTHGTPIALTYLWGTASVIFGVLLLLTCGAGLTAWWRTTRSWSSLPVTIRWLHLGVQIVLTVAVLNPRLSPEVRVSSGGRPATQLKMVLERALGEPRLHVITEVETRLTYAALGFLAVACSALMWRCLQANGDRTALLESIRRTHLLLHIGTACLVAGVVQVFLLYTWPAHFLPETSHAAVTSFAKGIALTAGANYTALLIAVFLPLLLLQRHLARHLQAPAEVSSPTGDGRDELWLLSSELEQSLSARIRTWGALLAPLATSLLSLVSSAG